MTKQTEALKLALEAMKAVKHGQCDHAWADEVIAAIVKALAEQSAPSQYGSPELQALIVARAMEKNAAEQPAQREAAPQQELVLANGLTEAETNATASVMGLTKKAQQEPVEVKQIAEALRQVGLTLVRTNGSFRVMDLGRIEAQTTSPPAQGKPLTDEHHRENFESWFRQKYHDRLDRNMPDKSYNSPHAYATWIGWCAALNIKENT